MYAFKRDITSRHNKSTNKCQPVFAIMAGFRREGAMSEGGKTQAGKEKEEGKKRGHKHVLHGLGARTNGGPQSPTL